MVLRRIVIVVAFALLGLVVTGSGLDRMSDAGALAAGTVPSPFRANAQRIEAARLVEARDWQAATAAARRAIARNPIDPRTVALYGEARLIGADADGAARAFAVSRRLGWREPLTNLYWIDQGLRRDDLPGALDHLDALLRQSPTLPQRGALLARIEATPAGRSALASRLARGPAWRTSYFSDTAAPQAGDPIARSEVARRLAVSDGVHNCGLVSPMIGALLRFRHMPQAQGVYALHCAAPGEPPVPADGRFVRASAGSPPTALDWRFTGEGAVGVSIEPRPGIAGRAVVVGNLSSVALAFASETVALAPGPHRVSWRALDAEGAASPAIDAAIGCWPEDHPWAAKRLIDPRSGRFSAEAVVPPTCATPTLSFGIAPGASGIALAEVTID